MDAISRSPSAQLALASTVSTRSTELTEPRLARAFAFARNEVGREVLPQRAEFYRITQFRARAVGFDQRYISVIRSIGRP